MQEKRNQRDKVFEKLFFYQRKSLNQVQGCVLYVAAPSGPKCLTFASGQLENLKFPLEIVHWVP